MRVITGLAKGRKLKTVKGLDVRPTTDRVKQSLFNVIGPRVEGCRFLDLFAGSGQNGIEALSRGALAATFVDQSPASLAVLAENLAATGFAAQATVLRSEAGSAVAALAGRAEPFDLIFLDPPYRQGFVSQLLPKLGDLSAPGGWVIAEHDRREEAPAETGQLNRFRQLTFGDTVLSLYKKS